MNNEIAKAVLASLAIADGLAKTSIEYQKSLSQLNLIADKLIKVTSRIED